MPFINGRYYVNPIMGEALEAAREAEAALAALENSARQNSRTVGDGPSDDVDGESGSLAPAGDGPIHRVEIEAAELVPAHSGRGARGYVARVHRQQVAGPAPGMRLNERTRGRNSGGETHVFADHRDLVSFLRDELARDSHSRNPKE